MRNRFFHFNTRLSNMIMLACILSLGLVFPSCNKNEEDIMSNETENNETENNENSESSNYTEDMFVGIWIKIQSVNSANPSHPIIYDDPNEEWSIMFESDKQHGSFRHFWAGNPSISDFKWWLTTGNKVRIVELNSGADYEVEATFTDNNTWLIWRYDNGDSWEEETYVKKGYNPYY